VTCADRRLRQRRQLAAAALLLAGATVILAASLAVARFPDGLPVLACLAAAGVGFSYGTQSRGDRRRLATATGAGALAGGLVLMLLEGNPLTCLLILATAVGATAAARQAFAIHAQLPAVPRPRRPVLFYNPRAGDGTPDRLHLADEAIHRGIEPIRIRLHDDLEWIARDAVIDGADGLAMAGGDESQAIVAAVAAESDLPYACVPAGTRNHFALDLGVDREDVIGALDALVSGGERRVDLAEVNGRTFVNSVSLGVYANAVKQVGHREAKIQTPVSAASDDLGPDEGSPTLARRDGGREATGLVMVVSNNGYRLGRGASSVTRPRLDAGALGVTVFGRPGTRQKDTGRRLGPPDQWSTPTFTIDSDRPVPAGIDGEPVELEPPLRFRIRPQALRVRIARNHPGASPCARLPSSPPALLGALVRLTFRGVTS
jgi:diacylglycerol kinase family enzyme